MAEDVLFEEILTRLPPKSVTRFKTVSRAWLAHLSSIPFIANHLHHHSTTEKPSDIIRGVNCDDDEEVARLFRIADGESNPVEMDMSYVVKAQERSDIMCFFLDGSSNGLLLIRQLYAYEPDYEYCITLWNPATREFRNLPEPIVPVITQPTCPHSGFHIYNLGFGIDCNDYKVVRVGKYHKPRESGGAEFSLHVQLFTRNTGCWREIGVLSCRELLRSVEGGAVIDGFVHWAIGVEEAPAKGSQLKILTFDLNTEEVMEIDSPVSENKGVFSHLEIVKWKGSLGALMTKVGGECEFWVKSNAACWTKVSVIKPPVSMWPFRGVLRDHFLLFDNHDRKDMLFDPVTQAQTNCHEQNGEINFYNFQHYSPSLISPGYNV